MNPAAVKLPLYFYKGVEGATGNYSIFSPTKRGALERFLVPFLLAVDLKKWNIISCASITSVTTVLMGLNITPCANTGGCLYVLGQ